MGPGGTLPGRDLEKAVRGRVYGAVHPGGVWWGWEGLSFLRVADRGDQPCRRRGGGDARGAHERRDVADTHLRHRGPEVSLRARPGPGGENRVLCPHRAHYR